MATASESPLSQGNHFFPVDGITILYHVRGTGPLLIIQSVGWGMSGATSGTEWARTPKTTNTALYFEPRGNGQSSKPPRSNPVNARAMAGDVEHLRRHLGLEVLRGSHAGALVLRYAEEDPPRTLAKLILFDSQIIHAPPNTNPQDWIAHRKDDTGDSASVAKLSP